MQDLRLVPRMVARHDDLASRRIETKNGRIFDMLHRVVRTVPVRFMFSEFEMMIFCFLGMTYFVSIALNRLAIQANSANNPTRYIVIAMSVTTRS